MTLRLRGEIALPAHTGPGGFDHGDVHAPTGRVFIAHTSNDSVEVVDGPAHRHIATIHGCAEASGVLCASDGSAVLAAARGAGRLLVIDPVSLDVRMTISVGGRPNGLAWDSRRGRVLVADVAGDRASIVRPLSGDLVADTPLPGRPRWAVYDAHADRFLVNIRDPALVAVLEPERGVITAEWPVSSAGPHGLDLDGEGRRAFVACDGGRLVVLDSASGEEVGSVGIAGSPDAIWFNQASRKIFVAIGDPGVLQVVDVDGLTVDETIETGPKAQTTALDRARQELFVFVPSTCSASAYKIG